jgi:hypothetical protein
MPGMKRLGRIVVNGVTVMSLVLALGVAGSWVRSYWRMDVVCFEQEDHRHDYALGAAMGFVAYQRRIFDGILSRPHGFRYWSSPAIRLDDLPKGFPGFRWRRDPDDSPVVTETLICVSHAYLLALFLLLPALRFYRWFRRVRRVIPGHCLKCGYDLRATPDRCPECGTAATPTAVAAEWKRVTPPRPP